MNDAALSVEGRHQHAAWPDHCPGGAMTTTELIVIIVVLLLLFGGGGYFWRGR
jgi:hypothetical protein